MIKPPIVFAVALATVADFVCILLAGAGHGTYVPACIFFGPMTVFQDSFIPAFLLGPSIYWAYAAFIFRGTNPRAAVLRVTAVTAVHYGSALVGIVQTGEDLDDCLRILAGAPELGVLCIVVWICVNVLLASAAWSMGS